MATSLPSKSLNRLPAVYLAVCLTLCPIVAAPAGAKNNRVQTRTFAYQGRESVYRLFVSDALPAGGAAPLVLLLHGTDENGLTMADPWSGLAAKEGIVLLAPDLESQGPDFFIALVDSVRAQVAVNPRRIYLFGNAAGTTLALLLSLIDSRYYAATAVHAGSFRDDYRAAPQFLERANRKIPIAMWNGTADERVPLSSVRATRDLLAKFEFPVELHEMLGWDHNYARHSDELNQAVWEFLRGHQLEEDPTSQPYQP